MTQIYERTQVKLNSNFDNESVLKSYVNYLEKTKITDTYFKINMELATLALAILSSNNTVGGIALAGCLISGFTTKQITILEGVDYDIEINKTIISNEEDTKPYILKKSR